MPERCFGFYTSATQTFYDYSALLISFAILLEIIVTRVVIKGIKRPEYMYILMYVSQIIDRTKLQPSLLKAAEIQDTFSKS